MNVVQESLPSSPTGAPFPGVLAPAQRDDLLLLARAWMPGLKLSKDERCGEILGVMAKVFPYAESGLLVNDLDRAARVEITYTVFLREDGGRFDRAIEAAKRGLGLDLPWIGGVIQKASGAHPGDNEGFSIGLVRTQRSEGRCASSSPRFELYAAKSAAHKDAAGGLIQRAHDRITAAEWAGPCPPAGSGSDYFVWVGENKHGIYFHQAVCEAEVMYSEECEDGREAYDLSESILLFAATDPYAKPDCNTGEPPPHWVSGDHEGARYDLSGTLVTYACSARGKPRISPPVADANDPNLLHFSIFPITGHPESIDYWVEFGFFEAPVAMPQPTPEPATTQTTVTELVRVPDLTGLDLSAAELELQSLGLHLQVEGTTEVTPDSGLIDVVARQDIPPGGGVEPGRTISVWIGEVRVNLVDVPDLGQLPLDLARSRVEALGLVLVIDHTEYAGTAMEGRVIDQDPMTGRVPQGSVIRVTIGGPPDAPTPPDLQGIVLRHDGIGGLGNWCPGSTCPNGVMPFGVSAGVPLDVLGSALGAPDEDTGWISSFSRFGTCPGDEVRGLRWGGLWVLMTDGSTEYSSSPHMFAWYNDDPAFPNEWGVRMFDTLGEIDDAFPVVYEEVSDAYYVNFGPDYDSPRLIAWVTGPGLSDEVVYMVGGRGCGE